MKEFWLKTINGVLLVMLLLCYNAAIERRAQAEEIGRLKAEVETSKLQLEEYKKAYDNMAGKDKDMPSSSCLYTDGEYEGSAKGFGGDIVVRVTIERDTITNLAIVSASGEDRAYLETAGSIVNEILRQQTAEVDTVSGATFSSKGIREAAKAALEKALVK